MKVAIVGGGIGGMALALSLLDAGRRLQTHRRYWQGRVSFVRGERWSIGTSSDRRTRRAGVDRSLQCRFYLAHGGHWQGRVRFGRGAGASIGMSGEASARRTEVIGKVG